MKTINIFNNKENNNIIKDELNLLLDSDTDISFFNTDLKKLTITVKDNINININDFNTFNTGTLKIIFNIHSNANVKYNVSNIINNNYNIDIFINYLGQNSKVETNIHSLVSGKTNIKINGIVRRNSKENELLENIKVMLIDNGQCEVKPDIEIDTNKVIANHKVAISNIRNNELFYLMSKGLSEYSSNNLIKKSFLVSNIKNKELINKINEIL